MFPSSASRIDYETRLLFIPPGSAIDTQLAFHQ
jgi:hypothetical protein